MFTRSSPKVILWLRQKEQQCPFHPIRPIEQNSPADGYSPVLSEMSALTLSPLSQPWTCPICEESNRSDTIKCSLCGVRRAEQPMEAKAGLSKPGWSCAVCTFENGPDQKCEMCGTARETLLAPTTPIKSASPDCFVKLSFRGDNPSNFLAHLQVVLQKAAWQLVRTDQHPSSVRPLGVAGLMKQAEATARQTDQTLSVAFTDLDALLGQAGEMARLADTIAGKMRERTAKSSSSSGGGDELDETQSAQFRDIIRDLGLSFGAADSVTRSSAGWAFHLELARQLAGMLEVFFAKRFANKNDSISSTNVIPIADIYCLINRARGTSLISPQDLLTALEEMPKISGSSQSSFRLTRLGGPKGVLAVQKASAAYDQILKRILETYLVSAYVGISALEVSGKESITLAAAIELLTAAEQNGELCRDEGTSQVLYFRNEIMKL